MKKLSELTNSELILLMWVINKTLYTSTDEREAAYKKMTKIATELRTRKENLGEIDFNS